MTGWAVCDGVDCYFGGMVKNMAQLRTICPCLFRTVANTLTTFTPVEKVVSFWASRRAIGAAASRKRRRENNRRENNKGLGLGTIFVTLCPDVSM